MKIEASNPDEYIANAPKNRQEPLARLRKAILQNLPKGFEETMNYGMIGYVIPHSLYPNGYHCDPKLPLPFINIASQKNYIALYHMGMYADPQLLSWFKEEYPKYCSTKLDIGKSCVRFKKPEIEGNIPYILIALLVKQITPKKWIELYKKQRNSGKC